MEGSVGQALRNARLKKNLTIDEVSRVTKIRPPRIEDLENDDYTRFPNLAYARSFLVLYAKYLGVDISKYPIVEVGSTVGLGDYQYLRGEETERPLHPRPDLAAPPEKPRWLIVFFVFLAMAAFGALIGWGVMNYLRLGPMENLVNKNEARNAPVPPPQPTATGTPAQSPTPLATATPSPAASPSASPENSAQTEAVPVLPAEPVAATPPSSEPDVRRAEPLTTGSTDAAILAEAAAIAGQPNPDEMPAAVFPPAGAEREIKVRVTKRTKVRIVRDNPKASSVYHGFMNPAQATQSFRGKQFWIKATDPDAVKVTIGGQPATGPEAGVEITRSTGL